jgi:hypothetical protein
MAALVQSENSFFACAKPSHGLWVPLDASAREDVSGAQRGDGVEQSNPDCL